jgi:membrane protein implicated in regulation of membrane protease activity
VQWFVGSGAGQALFPSSFSVASSSVADHQWQVAAVLFAAGLGFVRAWLEWRLVHAVVSERHLNRYERAAMGLLCATMAAGGGVLLALGGQAAASIAAGVRGTDVTAALLLLLPLTGLLVLQLVGRMVLENSWQCNDLAWLRWQVSLIGQLAAVS